MHVLIMITITALGQLPTASQPTVRQLIGQAWKSQTTQTGTSELIQQLREQGVTCGKDLLPYLGESPRMAAAVLMLLWHMEPIDAEVRTRIQSALPSLSGQAEMWAVHTLLKDDKQPLQTASSLVNHVRSSGLYALLSWAVQNHSSALALACLQRAVDLVKRTPMNYTVFEILALQDKPFLNQPELRQEMLTLGLTGCAHPENLAFDSLIADFRFVLTKGLTIDRPRVESTLKDLVANGPDPIPALICWQIFLAEVEDTEHGRSLLAQATHAHPDLRGVIEQFADSHFSRSEPYGRGSAKPIALQISRDLQKLRPPTAASRPSLAEDRSR